MRHCIISLLPVQHTDHDWAPLRGPRPSKCTPLWKCRLLLSPRGACRAGLCRWAGVALFGMACHLWGCDSPALASRRANVYRPLSEVKPGALLNIGAICRGVCHLSEGVLGIMAVRHCFITACYNLLLDRVIVSGAPRSAAT